MSFTKPSKHQKISADFRPWVTSGSTHATIKIEAPERGAEGSTRSVSLADRTEELAREARRSAAQRKLELMRSQHTMGRVLLGRARQIR